MNSLTCSLSVFRLCMYFIFILIINTNLMKFNNILVYCGFLWFQRPNGCFSWATFCFVLSSRWRITNQIKTNHRENEKKKSILFNMVCNLASQQHHYITVSRKYSTCTPYTHTLLSPKNVSKSGATPSPHDHHHHQQPIQMTWIWPSVKSKSTAQKTKSSATFLLLSCSLDLSLSLIYCWKEYVGEQQDNRTNIWAL